jgi:hypothetical protein
MIQRLPPGPVLHIVLVSPEGRSTPEAIRWYRVFVGSDAILIKSEVGDPVTAILEGIYKNAVKGDG